LTNVEIVGGWAQNVTTSTLHGNFTSRVGNLVPEGEGDVTYHTAGTFQNLWLYVISNGKASATNWRLRKNQADSAIDISIGSSATGEFTDASTVTCADGDDFNYQYDPNGVSGTIVFGRYRIEFVADSGTTTFFTTQGDNTQTLSTDVDNMPLAGFSMDDDGTLVNGSIDLNGSGTFHDLFLNVKSNGGGVTAFDLQADGVDTAIGVSIGSNATGIFEDTTSTHSATASEVFEYFIDVPNTQNRSLVMAKIEFDPDTKIPFLSGDIIAASISVDTYYAVGGEISGSATEANREVPMKNAWTWSDIGCRVDSNSRNGASTWIGRINRASGNQSVSIGDSATGIFDDTTNTDSISADDDINYFLDIGGSTGSMTIGVTRSLLEAPAAGFAYSQGCVIG
jgi:hypothetical protein